MWFNNNCINRHMAFERILLSTSEVYSKVLAADVSEKFEEIHGNDDEFAHVLFVAKLQFNQFGPANRKLNQQLRLKSLLLRCTATGTFLNASNH